MDKEKLREIEYKQLEELALSGKNVSKQLFLKCLAHPFQYIRIEAIRCVSGYCREDFTWIFAIALNDKCDFVVGEAANALAKIDSDETLEILKDAFFEGVIERPHHLADAISAFGEKGQKVLLSGIENTSPNVRYYSAKFLGSSEDSKILNLLEEIALNDNEKTSFGGLVSTAARRRLKVLTKKLKK
jgi:hypothetical protein